MAKVLCIFALAALCFTFALGGEAVLAASAKVDLELVLAVDVSGSMDDDEHYLQRKGYEDAFRHPQIVAAISSGYHGRIALTYVEWAGPSSQVVTVPWRIIKDRQSANAFADRLAETPIAFIRGTSISGGLAFAASLFDDNEYDGFRRVIDVSGDGPNNMGMPVRPVRDRVVARGITINGLPLVLKPYASLRYAGVDLDAYYRDCVIGGRGAFTVAVDDPALLAKSIRRKLVLEIAGRIPRIAPAASVHFVAQFANRSDCMIGEKMRQDWDEP